MQRASRSTRAFVAPSSLVAMDTPASVRCAGSRNLRPQARCTLLWVDDFEPGLAMYKIMFEALGFKVLTAASGAEGLRLATRNYVDVVVTDYEMPGMNGEAFATAIKSMKPSVPVVMFSGSTLISPRCRRVVNAFCDKAGSRDALLAAIHRLLSKKRPVMLQPPVAPPASHHGHRTVA